MTIHTEDAISLGDIMRTQHAGAQEAPSRIAVFLQDLYGGGAERVMLALATGIARRGYPVDLVLVRREGAYVDDIPPGIRVVELGTRRTVNSVVALARYLRRERPAVLLTALVHVNIAALLARLLAGGRTRIAITEHNQISRNMGAKASSTLRMAYRLVPYLYPRAAKIIAVSGGVADDLTRFARLDRGRIDVAHNPVVTPDLLVRAAEPVNHPWFAEGEPPVILGVGRLSPQKDFANLLLAFARVRAKRPARLLILGEGALRPDLEQLADELGISKDVQLPGFVDNPMAFMAKASLFVLSSQFEGLPTVLIEAIACGTNTVSTDCPSGPREILEDGRLGGLVPVGDSEALAHAIEQGLDNPVPADLLRAKAEEFTVERAVDRYLELLQPAAARSIA
ncbi:glycosyltransferase [Skermanella sp. TT6]|uniref:Glycosyltransferase n=1 Tax=Skermanella cutis TaxID=2775420 RepID=A0ABX7BF79_9PROT|nr:glycosyltransferase [Skermanella sp. TT6]QQP91082.1 glycosyltransferase [Skermanella sp. TT6]